MENAEAIVHVTLNLAANLKMIFRICSELSFVFQCVRFKLLADGW